MKKKKITIDFKNLGIEGEYGFVFQATKEKFHIDLSVTRRPKSEEEAKSLAIIMDELNDYVLKHHQMLLREAGSLCKALKLDETTPESHDTLEFMIKKHFKRYILANEIDILCKIEREKSPDYPSKYTVNMRG